MRAGKCIRALLRPDPHLDVNEDAWFNEFDEALVGAMLIADHHYWFRAVHRKES